MAEHILNLAYWRIPLCVRLIDVLLRCSAVNMKSAEPLNLLRLVMQTLINVLLRSIYVLFQGPPRLCRGKSLKTLLLESCQAAQRSSLQLERI